MSIVVKYFHGNNFIGESSQGPDYPFEWTSPSEGELQIKAEYYVNGFLRDTTDIINITVVRPPSPFDDPLQTIDDGVTYMLSVSDYLAFEFNPVIDISEPSSGYYKYKGATLGVSGKVYYTPQHETQVMVVDPSDDSKSLIGVPNSAQYKWVGGALAPNGKIYCAPYSTNTILVINTNDDSTEEIDIGFNPNKHSFGAVLGTNGQVYFMPHNTDTVLKIDPETHELSYIEGFGGLAQTYGGVLAPNGKIYLIPANNKYLITIDTLNNDAVEFDIPLPYGDFDFNYNSLAWMGGVLAPNGKIYCPPYRGNTILVINPEDNSSYQIDGTGVYGTIYNKFHGVVLGPDGKVYFIPYKNRNVIILDPSDDSLTLVPDFTNPSPSPIGDFTGGVLAPNGKIYCPPEFAQTHLTIGEGGLDLDLNFLLSRYN
jgi:streptogramin lyase